QGSAGVSGPLERGGQPVSHERHVPDLSSHLVHPFPHRGARRAQRVGGRRETSDQGERPTPDEDPQDHPGQDAQVPDELAGASGRRFGIPLHDNDRMPAAAPASRDALSRAARGWLDHLRVERGSSEHTLQAYERDLRRYLDFLRARRVTTPGAVSESTVTDFLAQLRTGEGDRAPLAASSAARALVVVRGFHRFLAAEGDVAHDPAQVVAPPTPARRLPKAISVEEVERLLDAASVGDTPVTLRDRALLEVLYGSGARVSEAIGIDVDDLDLGRGEGTGTHPTDQAVVRLFGKGNKERIVPLGRYATDAVEAWLVRGRPVFADQGRGTPAVFLNQ